eukprot:scaffold24952_cov101-Isochrysis_galbana.AAC.1
MIAIVARLVNRIRTFSSPDESRPISHQSSVRHGSARPSLKRCSQPCKPPVRLSSEGTVGELPLVAPGCASCMLVAGRITCHSHFGVGVGQNGSHALSLSLGRSTPLQCRCRPFSHDGHCPRLAGALGAWIGMNDGKLIVAARRVVAGQPRRDGLVARARERRGRQFAGAPVRRHPERPAPVAPVPRVGASELRSVECGGWPEIAPPCARGGGWLERARSRFEIPAPLELLSEIEEAQPMRIGRWPPDCRGGWWEKQQAKTMSETPSDRMIAHTSSIR